VTAEETAVRIADLITAVGSALGEAQTVLEENGLALKAASLTVEAVNSTDNSLGLDWSVVSGVASKTTGRTAEMVVAFDVASLPPASTNPSSNALRSTLESIVHAVKSQSAGAKPAAIESLTLEIEFTVTRKREVGLAFEVLNLAKLEPERTKSKTKSQTLSVILSRKAAS
jgi:hypothetical protein